MLLVDEISKDIFLEDFFFNRTQCPAGERPSGRRVIVRLFFLKHLNDRPKTNRPLEDDVDTADFERGFREKRLVRRGTISRYRI